MPSEWVILSAGTSLHHTLRNDNGTWQGQWGDVFAAMHGKPDSGSIKSLTSHTDLSGNLHICVLTSIHNVWHTIRLAAGTWQSNWGNVNAASTGLPSATVTSLASSVSGDNTFQLCAVADNVIYHTVRHPNGTWQGSWGNVDSQAFPPLPITVLAGG
jgi:hypothetical protein